MRAILTYHSIDGSGSPISMPPERFRAHVRWLASGLVAVVPLDALLRGEGGDSAVALTFDDAFANFATHAAPLLAEHAFPATLFVPTGFVGGRNAWAGTGARGIPDLPLLGWSALARLAERGIALGSHGRTHRPLAGLAASDLADEVEGSAEDLLRHTGVRPRAFAYPYGSVDGAAASRVRAVYDIGCTTVLRGLRDAEDPVWLPRVDAYYLRAPGRLESWGTAHLRRYLRLRAVARRLREAYHVG
ncbi:MAG TPA: polysaccharide deacetylase family protein [Gemmatimonadaceae bacterium]|nr:polysaccharide deacetylase family protein [Gemmatimonadaceae bacterium]